MQTLPTYTSASNFIVKWKSKGANKNARPPKGALGGQPAACLAPSALCFSMGSQADWSGSQLGPTTGLTEPPQSPRVMHAAKEGAEEAPLQAERWGSLPTWQPRQADDSAARHRIKMMSQGAASCWINVFQRLVSMAGMPGHVQSMAMTVSPPPSSEAL